VAVAFAVAVAKLSAGGPTNDSDGAGNSRSGSH
jgi:hypothetical protein